VFVEVIDEVVSHDAQHQHKPKTRDCLAMLKRDDVLALVRDRTGFEGFILSELLKGIENYWADRELRNRYFHDDWFVVIRDGTPAIRGLARKKGSKISRESRTSP
jgi:hypothetical protein